MPQEQIEEYMKSGHGSLRGLTSSEPAAGVDDAEEDPDEPMDMNEFQRWLEIAVGKPSGNGQAGMEEPAAPGGEPGAGVPKCERCSCEPCGLL